MASMLGVVTCPECGRTIALKGRQGTILRPPGAGWRELAT
jgi:DNA-directed RNA polymerase subunit RPC12/RpoP